MSKPRGQSRIQSKVPPPLESDDLDVKCLIRLAFDTLSCVDHRISPDQRELKSKEKLGAYGADFDSILHCVIDKLLLKSTWCDADFVKETLNQLVVSDGLICSKKYWKRWEGTRCTDKGSDGSDRWRKSYSARRNTLLFNRRLFVLTRPSSVLFGCLSSVATYRGYRFKQLVSDEFLGENQFAKCIAAGRVVFGAEYTYGELKIACFGRISLGIFFGMAGFTGDNLSQIGIIESLVWPKCFDHMKTVDPVIYSNPFTEMLAVCELFETRIADLMGRLIETNFFEIETSFEALTLALVNPKCEEIQALTYFDIVSLLSGVHRGVFVLFSTHDHDDWPETLNVNRDEMRDIFSHLDEIMDAFRVNVWYSDLHFFFAYFRGKLL